MMQNPRTPRGVLLDGLSNIARRSDDPAQKASAAVLELHRYVVAIAGQHAGKPGFTARLSAHLFSLAHELQARSLGASDDYETLYATVERLACELASADAASASRRAGIA